MSVMLKMSKSKNLLGTRMFAYRKKLPINYMFRTKQEPDIVQKRNLENSHSQVIIANITHTGTSQITWSRYYMLR